MNTAQLGQLVKVVGGYAFKSSDFSEDGHPVVRISNLRNELVDLSDAEKIPKEKIKTAKQYRVFSGDILIAMSGATTGKIGIVPHELDEEVYLNQRVGRYDILDGGELDQKYLQHFIKSNIYQNYILRVAAGAAQPNISSKQLVDIKIPLPPLDEQKRIAAILDQADALRRLRQEALDKLNTLAQSIFYEMFGDCEVEDRTVELSELVEPDDKINYGVVQPGEESADGIPLIRVGDLLLLDLNYDGLKKISADIELKYRRSRLNGDEILIACVGSIGVVALATAEVIGANIARAVARVPLDFRKANRIFIAEQLKTPKIQRYFGVETRAVAQPTLNIKQIKETKVVLPKLEKQNEFADRVKELDTARNLIARHLVAQESLFSSLQQRAFRGDL